MKPLWDQVGAFSPYIVGCAPALQEGEGSQLLAKDRTPGRGCSEARALLSSGRQLWPTLSILCFPLLLSLEDAQG